MPTHVIKKAVAQGKTVFVEDYKEPLSPTLVAFEVPKP
jgi:hypothetical protein